MDLFIENGLIQYKSDDWLFRILRTYEEAGMVPITFKFEGDNFYEKQMSVDDIKDVIFNNPATIVYWKDGSKTIVKCQDGDAYSEELGLAMCIVKKMCGNKGNYNNVFNKWLPKESE